MHYEFKAKLWLWSGKEAWYFISVPTEYFEELKQIGKGSNGFGSIRVSVIVGGTSWETSLFPDNKSKTYLLPIKQTIRTKEHLVVDATNNYSSELIV